MITESSQTVSVPLDACCPQVEKNSTKKTKKNLDLSKNYHSKGKKPHKSEQKNTDFAGGSGLVSSSTSGTLPEPFFIDRHKSRLRKLKYSVLTSARLHIEDLSVGSYRYRVAMLTLTYKDLDAWEPRHISDLLSYVRKWCKRRNIDFRYVWVGELQKRGALHYHVLIWLPKGVTLPKPDKQGWWKHGLTKIEWARNAIGYIAKYASKGEDNPDKFPKGVRIYGCGGLSENARNERCWWSMPNWVREIATVEDRPRRAIGGGILLKSTGEILESPWLFAGFSAKGAYIIKKPEFIH
ncbi:rolling circle replication-associated protein [Catenovulum sediminis]|uniref:Replication-associated protein ORF2/G2P domain-containing protein n=1 Tax=Catenovulum sediminis TaxID=1740262 RepID=A0ABV1RJ24_9ALTE